MNILIMGAGAGGAAAAAELAMAGHDVRLWGRSAASLAPFQSQGGVAHEGVLGDGLARLAVITDDLGRAIADADAAVIALPTFAHAGLARQLARLGWPPDAPIILNPGHTGGALAFDRAWRDEAPRSPPVASFSTLTYVARMDAPGRVRVTGRAKSVRAAALPGGETALDIACRLFPGAARVGDVLAADLANVNMVLHPPGAVLAAAWVEARAGDFTFYVDAMTPGVARVMRRLDGERMAVAAAFGHDLPDLIGEMHLIGTVETAAGACRDYAAAIAAGEANRRIKAPDSLEHRYYREDFGHGLLPFLELAAIAGVAAPVAHGLLTIAEAAMGTDLRATGRTAQAMGIAGLSREGLLRKVRSG